MGRRFGGDRGADALCGFFEVGFKEEIESVTVSFTNVVRLDNAVIFYDPFWGVGKAGFTATGVNEKGLSGFINDLYIRQVYGNFVKKLCKFVVSVDIMGEDTFGVSVKVFIFFGGYAEFGDIVGDKGIDEEPVFLIV
jgi:hypothetical protein